MLKQFLSGHAGFSIIYYRLCLRKEKYLPDSRPGYFGVLFSVHFLICYMHLNYLWINYLLGD